jgi:hypothetical protein
MPKEEARTMDNAHEPAIVLVASPDTALRSSLARDLSARGDRVILCAAPWTGKGSCPLVRAERCALEEVADVTVVSAEPARPNAGGAPTLCALSARRAVVVSNEPIHTVIEMIDDRMEDDPRF